MMEANDMSDHKGEEIKGRVKEAAGDLTGNGELKREGRIDRGSAAAKKTLDKVSDKLKDAVDSRK
jgi:uncharacterized protein YjbJ (UPF0337 family)